MKDTKAFNEIHKESGMSLSQMIKSIGRGSKEKKYAPPTDNERSEARLKQLETESK